MEENILLAAFTALPFITGLCIYLFFTKLSNYLQKTQWLKLIIGNILVFVFLCSTVLFFGEIYYRFLYDTTDAWGLTKVHEKWHKRHYQFNNYQMRDSINYEPKLHGKPRVTFIGDSFTAGHGVADVEKRFVNQIRAMRPDLEIHVFAVDGWDTYAEMTFILALIKSGYELQNIVLVYNLNDISDIMENWEHILEKIYSAKPGFLFEHSYFLNVLYYRYYAARNPEVSGYYDFILDAYKGPAWEKHKERLALMKPYFDSKNINFMVVTFPFLNNLGPNYEYRGIHKQLDAFWSSAGVPHLDLLSVYEPHRKNNLIVNPRDPHPNELAHNIAAKAILEFISENMTSRSVPDANTSAGLK